MTRAGVEQLLYLMDEAFDGNDEHSLIANLRSVTADDWLWRPPGRHRSIAEIVGHVGAAKTLYDNHAFGDASLSFLDPRFAPKAHEGRTPEEAMAWLRVEHTRLREHVAALDDEDLPKPRRTNWGEMKETRWIVSVMIDHDLYHSGEINHIRALHQDNDRWAWEPA